MLKKQRAERQDTASLPKELLMAYGKTKVKLEDVLPLYKGRFVWVELWASWCRPCLDEFPYLTALVETLPAAHVAFLCISIGANPVNWRNCLFQHSASSIPQLLLLQHNRTALYKQVQLETIPRFLIYNRSGVLINNDAPWPGDPELIGLLDFYRKHE